MNSLRLTLFGSPQITIKDQCMTLNRRKGVALLAYLAVTGRAQSREALANLFWPDYVSSTALAHLRRTLYALQQALNHPWLSVGRFQIGLNMTTDLWCDVLEFRRLLTFQASDCQHSPYVTCVHCLTRLQAGIALYTNDFLVGFALNDCPDFELWQNLEAEILRQELAAALEKVALAAEGQGQPAAAIGYWERLLQITPLYENGQSNLMRLYTQTGQRDLALRRYQSYCRQLSTELNAHPSLLLVQLHEQIRLGQPLAASPMPAATVSTALEPAAPLTSPSGRTGPGQVDPLAALGVLQRQKQAHFFHMIDQDGDGQIGWQDFERYVTRAAALTGQLLDDRCCQQALRDLRTWWEGIYTVRTLLAKALETNAPPAPRQITVDVWLSYWGLVQMMIVEEAAAGGRETLQRLDESTHIHCQLFDLDRDQRLSHQDYTAWVMAWGMGMDAADNFRRLDLDGDGYLHQNEISEYLRQFHFSNDPEAPGNRFYGHF